MTMPTLSFTSAARRRFLRAGVSLLMLIVLSSVLALVAQPRAVHSGEGAQPLGSITQMERGVIRSTTALSFTAAFTTYLPSVLAPPSDLKNLVTQTIFTLPQPLQSRQESFCTWDWCTLSPRLYHEPLVDGRTLIGWTDASGNGHISVISHTNLSELASFAGQSVRGLATHADGRFAVLRWDVAAKTMWLSKHQANGAEMWKTNLNTPIAVPEFWLGDGRLTYGSGKYAAYFTVTGVSGGFTGHYGDQLSYVNDSDVIQNNEGWDWGCSHSMAQLVSYHPQLSKFAPVCSSDCYASKGILVNDNQVIYPGDGDCGGMASAQLGQLAVADQSWKLIFNALNRPSAVGRGIGMATMNGSFQSSYVWLTNTNGDYERDPVMARVGTNLQSGRYLVGWMTIHDSVYRLGVIDNSGMFIWQPEDVSAAGITWGNRGDSFRTRADGTVSWVQGDANSTQLRLFRFDGSAFLTMIASQPVRRP